MTSHPPSDPKPPERAFVRVGTHVEFAEAMPPVCPAVSLDTQACDLEIAKNATLYNIKSFSPSSDPLNSVLRNLAGELISARNQSIRHASAFRKAAESRPTGKAPHFSSPSPLRTPHKKATPSNIAQSPLSYTPPRPSLPKATTVAPSRNNLDHQPSTMRTQQFSGGMAAHTHPLTYPSDENSYLAGASSSLNYTPPHLPPSQPTPHPNFNFTSFLSTKPSQSQSLVTHPQENIAHVNYNGSSVAQAYGSSSHGTNYPSASNSATPYNYIGKNGI
jgi:hypothetical protein